MPDAGGRLAIVGWNQWSDLLGIQEFADADHAGTDEPSWPDRTGAGCAEREGAPESFLDDVRKPPFVEMPLRVVSALGDHLEAHPWPDEAFATL